MMRKQHRLGALQVRVAGHNDVEIILRRARQLALQAAETRR